MNTEQEQAYKWAKNQTYQSVAARYAKLLTEAIDELEELLSAAIAGQETLQGELGEARRRERAAVKQLCQCCLALDAKAGRAPLCDPECPWYGREAGENNADRNQGMD